MAYPVYEDNGGIDAEVSNTNVYPAFPGTVNANDILIANICTRSATTWNTPAGWTAIDVIGRRALFYKRASGSESGTETFNNNGTNDNCYGIIYRYSGCILTGTPYEQYATANGTDTTVVIPDLAGATTGVERLCAAHTFSNNNFTAADDASNYSEQSDLQSSAGSDAAFFTYTFQQATAGLPGSDGFTQSGSTFFITRLIALIPVPTGYANNVNGVASANIGKVNGVATANIAKVVGS